ncbi:T9SS sorting signal type C domain-containing protein [Flavobacterium psychrotolerans]|nr:T9SS sorting signal type C domain-containing protein [Flavobacterium psychrotolerans]
MHFVIMVLFSVLIGTISYGQNKMIGDGFGGGWGGACNSNSGMVDFSASVGTSRISPLLTPSATGNRYWRVCVDWGGTIAQLSNGSDLGVTAGTTYTAVNSCTTSGAYFLNVSSTNNRYYIKYADASSAPSRKFVIFEFSATPITVSAVSNPGGTNGVASIITATLSASLPTGQDSYLRYSTASNFSTSTVVKMTGSGTSYTANVPSGTNTTGTVVYYYVFTSGTANVAADGSNTDFYTVNQNNNGGSNYSYTVTAAPTAPVLSATTFDANKIGATTASIASTVSSDGGSAVTERGIVYATTTTPTTGNTKVTNGTGTGTYNTSMSGLTPGTLYYVRSYAINSIGTSYGTQTTFTALMPPTGHSVVSASTTSLNLAWTRWTGDRAGASVPYNVMIVRSTDAVFIAPTDGTPYTAGVSTLGGDLVVYNSGGTTYTDTGLTTGVAYYYALYSEGWSYYSNAATTISAAPSGVVTGAKLSVNFNGGGNTWRYTNAQDACDGGSVTWVAANLGSMQTSGTLVISGANMVGTTGASSPKLYYRVYKQGSGAPAYTSANLTTTTAACGGGSKYEAAALNITIAAATYNVVGTYNFEVYHEATNGATINMGTSGSPYTATFNIVAAPTLTTTDAASLITGTTATSGGNVTSDGNSTVTERGIVYKTSTVPTTADTKVIVAGTTGAFVANMTGLSYGTTYYVRSYAINAIGTSYGTEISFTTSVVVPVVSATTIDANKVGATTASIASTISSDGGAAVTERGIVYATTTTPTTANTKVTNGTGIGTYNTTTGALTPGTLYYVRSYAINSAGTSYGTQTTFAALSPPTAQTAVSASPTSINLAWTKWTGDRSGSATPYNVMVVRSADAIFTQPTNGVAYTVGNAIGADTVIYNNSGTSFTDTGLTGGITYYYAFYSEGWSYYSNSATANAFPVTTAPVLATTTAADLIGVTTARSGGNVTSDGGLALTARGIVYATTTTPAIGGGGVTNVTTGTSTGTYTDNLTGLTAGTLYYIRAYATNSLGTTYGAQTTFTALSSPTSQTAVYATSTTNNLAWTRWTGDRAGVATAYNVMIVRSTDAVFTQPTDGVSYTAGSSTIGGDLVIYNNNGTSYTDTGLAANTNYYYAYYSEGWSYYSNSVMASVIAPLSITTAAISGLGCRGADAGGTVSGGGTITERGVVYNTSTNPTTSNTKVIVSGTTGSFTAPTLALSPNTTYYVRAYAIDGGGTVYGSNVSFTTGTVSVSSSFYSDRIYFKNGSNADEKYYMEDNSVPNVACSTALSETVGTANFTGKYLGTTNPGLQLKLGSYLITKGIQNGNTPHLNYRIYLTSAGPGATPYTTVNMNYAGECAADGVDVNSNNQDKIWRNPLFNITSPSSTGNYTIEIYVDRTGDQLGAGGAVYINNCGSNYKANFDVVRLPGMFSDVVYFDNGTTVTNHTGAGYDNCNTALTIESGYWNGKDLGSIIPGKVLKIGAMVLTLDGTSPVTAVDTKLMYRIYKNGGAVPGFSTMSLTEAAGTICGDAGISKFEQATLATLWTTTSSNGVYYIEFYYTAKLNDGTTITRNNSGSNYKASFSILVATPVGERDANDGNFAPTATNTSGIFESYMGVLVNDINGNPIAGLNRVFNMDGALSSSNSTNFDFDIQNPGLDFKVGTEIKVFTKGTHKLCGCSSWNYVYKATDPNPVATDFPLPPAGALFTPEVNGKFSLLNSTLSNNGNTPFFMTNQSSSPAVVAFGTIADAAYNTSLGATITKFKDYTDPVVGVVSTINNPVHPVLCPFCSGPYKVAVAMLAWVGTQGKCPGDAGFNVADIIFHRDINQNKVTDALLVLNPDHNDAPSSGTGSSSKNSLPGTDLFYISKVTIGASDGLKRWTGTGWEKFVNPSWFTSTAPTNKNDVLMSTNYSTSNGSFTCNDMTVNTGIVVTIEEGNYIEALNTVTTNGTGKIIVKNTGNFVQRCDEKPAIAYIEHLKTTGIKRKWDYEYWGTPIVQNMFSTKPSPFDIGYWRQAGAGGGWRALTSADMMVGKGYILRVGNIAPWNDGTSGYSTSWQINGTANNGIVSIPVTKEDASTTNYNNAELLANPYPCAVDGLSFVNDANNTGLNGSLYFWTSATQYPGSGLYQEADYAVWNASGSIAKNGITPNGQIPSGQGFFVRVLTPGTVVFKDYMRSTTANTQFYRMAKDNIVNRYWLSLTDEKSVDSEILVSYINGATNEMDRLYDAVNNSTSSTQLYSFVGDNKLQINGRSPFVLTDEVVLGVKKNSFEPKSLTLKLNKKEGIFADELSPIYLHDTDLNVYHNLQESPYTFIMTTNEDNNRFKLVYQNVSLGLNDFENNNAIAYIKNQKLNISSDENISKVMVYDISGRTVSTFNNKNLSKKIISDFNYSSGIYIVKIVLENGKSVSQKIMN